MSTRLSRSCVLLVLVLGLFSFEPAAAQVINEVLASHVGTDNTEYLEIFGAPLGSLNGLSLIVVESDVSGLGTIDRRIDFGTGNAIGANGFYLIGNPSGLLTNYGVTPN